MTVHKQKASHNQKNPQVSDDQKQPVSGDPVGARAGKEQEVVYRQQEQLLAEVQEKYKEADRQVAEQVKEAIGEAVKAKPEIVIPKDVADAGVKAHEQEASEVLKKDGTLEILTSQDTLKKDLELGVGGKRLINKTIVGAKSALAWALRLHRLVKVAHKHARRVIFKKRDFGNVVSEEKNAN